jgi:hypothetical protein
MENTPIHVCAKSVGELVLSITSCPSVNILENTLKLVYRKNVVMVTRFSYSLACTFAFGCGECYDGGPRVRRPPMKWSAITERMRNTVLPASSIEEACALSCASDNEASFKTPSSTDLLQKLPVAHPVKKLPVFYATARFMNGQWSASRPGRALAPGKGPPVPIGQEARVK